MKQAALTLFLFLFLSQIIKAQSIEKNLHGGKWLVCKMIDSTDIGDLGFENPDSFRLSVQRIIQKPNLRLRQIRIDTISNLEDRISYAAGFFKPFYDIYHDTWIEFMDDSNAVERIHEYQKGFTNIKRSYKYNAKTNRIIFDKLKDHEIAGIQFLSKDALLLTFYSERITLLLKRVN